MEKVELRLLLPRDVAKDLRGEADLASPRIVDDVNQVGLRFGLQEASALFTVVVGAAQLTDYCGRLAKHLLHKMSERQRQQLTAIAQGPRDDTRLEIHAYDDPAKVADRIERVVRRE